MIRQELHLHTTFCDGKNTPEELVRAAMAQGIVRLGFSGHGYAPSDTDFCMSREGEVAYRQEIERLKTAYAHRIEILCGVEQDYFGGRPDYPYDYVIGSVHSVKVGEVYLPVDHSRERFVNAVETYFGGDYLAFAEEYYRLVGEVAAQTGATIVGHFDLITKFNEGECLFSESDPRYKAAWQAAADKLIAAGLTFEVNTGAISRGYRTTPYPAAPILNYLKERGVPLLLTGDTHAAENLCYQFETWEPLVAPAPPSWQYCSRCGAQNPADAQFCHHCRACFAAPAVTVSAPPSSVLRTLATSGLFLAALILLTLSTAGDLIKEITTLVQGVTAPDWNNVELIELPADFYFWDAVFSTVINQIAYWLMLGGLWAVFASARRRESPLSLKGLGVVQAGYALSVAHAVITGAVSAALAIFSGISLNSYETLYWEDIPLELHEELLVRYAFLAGTIFAAVILLAAVAVRVIGYITIRSTFRAARESLQTGVPVSRGVSAFVAILAFITAFGLLADGQLLGALANVFFGMLQLQFRRQMRQAQPSHLAK